MIQSKYEGEQVESKKGQQQQTQDPSMLLTG